MIRLMMEREYGVLQVLYEVNEIKCLSVRDIRRLEPRGLLPCRI